MFYAQKDARYVWQESYNIYVNKLEEARTRTMVLARWLENDYRQREVEYQRQI